MRELLWVLTGSLIPLALFLTFENGSARHVFLSPWDKRPVLRSAGRRLPEHEMR